MEDLHQDFYDWLDGKGYENVSSFNVWTRWPGAEEQFDDLGEVEEFLSSLSTEYDWISYSRKGGNPSYDLEIDGTQQQETDELACGEPAGGTKNSLQTWMRVGTTAFRNQAEISRATYHALRDYSFPASAD